ncbi:M81 family metallopeptidase [Glaciimonas sp. PCH181]|uniref:M81 family metallopeptidase n=1 Tax=Glaciimonas sp. PCH181 TaxID=2133943 RepID=UPI0013751458|nr:M81 family metallopeptidase [Glaciimonas sp. PCH181]
MNTSEIKRVAVVSFEFEGNSFSPKVCGRPEFGLYAEGEAIWDLIDGNPLAISGGVDALKADGGIKLIPILLAHGGSGGTVEPHFYRETVDAILKGIREQGPFDGLYLALHGAMISPGVTDGEGQLLEAIRSVVGSMPIIACSLDLHANVTPKMVQAANILVGYENYPHDDVYTTGQRAGDLLVRTLRGTLSPVMRMVRLDMLVPVPGGSTLGNAPLAKLKAFARGCENDGVVSTSYFTCQPWLDDDAAGNVALAIAHDSEALAERTARVIADKLWALRDEFVLPLLPVQDAIEKAIQAHVKPAVLADTGDSVGAGSTGDSAYVLAALLTHASDIKCAVSMVDPDAVAKAIESGVGTEVELALGFSADPRHGAPLKLRAKVCNVHNGKFTYAAGPAAGVQGDMGPTVVLGIQGIRILVASKGTYEYADEQFRAVGINPDDFAIVVLKNGMNFRNLLKDGSSWYLVDSAGSSSANLATLRWQHRPSPFWPRDIEVKSLSQP